MNVRSLPREYEFRASLASGRLYLDMPFISQVSLQLLKHEPLRD